MAKDFYEALSVSSVPVLDCGNHQWATFSTVNSISELYVSIPIRLDIIDNVHIQNRGLGLKI